MEINIKIKIKKLLKIFKRKLTKNIYDKKVLGNKIATAALD